MYVERDIEGHCRTVAGFFPVVAVLGPRQSGKTTLCRHLFPDLPYVSLEPSSNRDFALEDPAGFARRYRDGAIIDEVQRVPSLLSELQGLVDEDPAPGRFVLTGSANLDVMEAVTQSLAGRVATVTLLPMCLDELRRFPAPPADLFVAIAAGGYPPVYDRTIPPPLWYENYVTHFVERDLRQIVRVGDLHAFRTFLRLSAGRTAGLFNASSLSADVGMALNTVRSWTSALEASYLVHRLEPLHANLRRRLVKTPKVHLVDTGVASSLLAITTPAQVESHPLRGALVESWVASEALKTLHNSGQRAFVGFYRDHRGLEVDLVMETADGLVALEVKSGTTVPRDATESLTAFRGALEGASPGRRITTLLVYGGDEVQTRGDVRVVPWHGVGAALREALRKAV